MLILDNVERELDAQVAWENREASMKFPLLASLPARLDKHNHHLEAIAERSHIRISNQEARALKSADKLEKHLAGVDGILDANDQYLEDLDRAIGDNGGPTSAEALPASAPSSPASPPANLDSRANSKPDFEQTALGPMKVGR